MRSDFKIGIAVGLFVILVAVVYFIAAGGGSGSTNGNGQVARDKMPQPGKNNQVEGVPETTGTKGEATEGGISGSGGTETTAVTPTGDNTIEIGFGGAGGTTPAAAVEGSAAETSSTSGEPAAGSAGASGTLASPSTPAAGNTATGSESAPQPVDIQQPEPIQPEANVYVVQPGDQGFWGIAEKVYKDGKYFTLIARANPDVDTNNLHPGQRLRIPALPTPAAGGGGVVAPSAGRSAAPGTAGGVYIVRKGDLGFWGIAKNVYGDGKYFTLIAKANPNVDPRNIRPGQRLKVLPKPAEGTAAGTVGPSTGLPVPPSIAGAGNGYVVRKGDLGFWGIAQKVYKDGKYWSVIAKANPGVDPRNLKPGQRLNVPSLTAAARAPAGRAVRHRSSPSPAAGGDGRPYFGNYVPQ